MRNILIIACLLLFMLACKSQTIAICPDGSIVNDPLKCPKVEIPVQDQGPPEIERVSRLFGIYWQNKEYNNLYRYLHPDLKNLRTEAEFQTIFGLSGLIEKDISVEFRSLVFESDTSAYANYIITNNIGTIRPVSIKTEFIEDNWRFYVFEDVLSKEVLSAACSQSGSPDACAFAAAKKLNRVAYCEYTGCNYENCLVYFNQLITSRERRHYCDLCEVQNCLQSQAVKYKDPSLCGSLDESTQFNAFDKYYYCYGNIANTYNDLSVCDTLRPDAFKYACVERVNNPSDNTARKNDVFRIFTRMYFSRPAV